MKIQKIPAHHVMTRDVFYMFAHESLRAAYAVMQDHGFRHIPIVDQRVLIGILSDRDVMVRSHLDDNGEIQVPEVEISTALTRHPVACRVGETIAQVAQVMIEKKIDSIPVVDDKRELRGIITSTDLLEMLAKQGIDPAQTIPIQFNLHVKVDPSNKKAS